MIMICICNSVVCFCSQLELITAQAMKAGFTGGLVVDYPNSSKAKKYLFSSIFPSSLIRRHIYQECV